LNASGFGGASAGTIIEPYERGPKWSDTLRGLGPRTWNVMLGCSIPVDINQDESDRIKGITRTLVFEGLDAQKRPIRWVNSEGISVATPSNVSNEIKKAYDGLKKPKDQLQNLKWVAMVGSTSDHSGFYSLRSNIDPAKMAWLRIRSLSSKSVRLTGIPLEPKGY
jgi:hypothetical protein